MDTHSRTNVVIDDALMEEAMRASGTRTKRETVELGLRTLVRLKRQEQVRRLRGLGWEGDLEAMRRDR
ncbi:MAG TPA: type II toxin-antitoxin system VapB family antitoxin [Allosphingosinicella sp.]|jgi:Arc/MetJ family transcription regulator